MAFLLGLVLGVLVGIGLVVAFAKSENARSTKRRALVLDLSPIFHFFCDSSFFFSPPFCEDEIEISFCNFMNSGMEDKELVMIIKSKLTEFEGTYLDVSLINLLSIYFFLFFFLWSLKRGNFY